MPRTLSDVARAYLPPLPRQPTPEQVKRRLVRKTVVIMVYSLLITCIILGVNDIYQGLLGSPRVTLYWWDIGSTYTAVLAFYIYAMRNA